MRTYFSDRTRSLPLDGKLSVMILVGGSRSKVRRAPVRVEQLRACGVACEQAIMDSRSERLARLLND